MQLSKVRMTFEAAVKWMCRYYFGCSFWFLLTLIRILHGYFEPPDFDSFSITWSRLKLAAFWCGGYSLIEDLLTGALLGLPGQIGQEVVTIEMNLIVALDRILTGQELFLDLLITFPAPPQAELPPTRMGAWFPDTLQSSLLCPGGLPACLLSVSIHRCRQRK